MKKNLARKTESGGSGKFRRKLAAAALVLSSFAAPIAAATPAHAATATSFCFKWGGGAAYANRPVFLMSWQSGRWVSIRSGKTAANGCGTFWRVPSSGYTTVMAREVLGDHNFGLALFEGMSPRYAVPGSGTAQLGTGYVSLIQCTQGSIGYCAGQV